MKKFVFNFFVFFVKLFSNGNCFIWIEFQKKIENEFKYNLECHVYIYNYNLIYYLLPGQFNLMG